MQECVHVNPKGGRRAPSLRSEYGARPACRVRQAVSDYQQSVYVPEFAVHTAGGVRPGSPLPPARCQVAEDIFDSRQRKNVEKITVLSIKCVGRP